MLDPKADSITDPKTDPTADPKTDPAADPKFTLRFVFLTALITFGISGLGGIGVSEWLSRAKPLITIGAVGFVGSDEPIEVADTIISSTHKSPLIRNYQPLEIFESIARDYAKADDLRKKLGRSLELVEHWLAQFAAEDGRTSLTPAQISHALSILDGTVEDTLVGMARRGELQEAPIKLEELAKSAAVKPLTDGEHFYTIHDGDNNFRLRYAEFGADADLTAAEREAAKLLAYSFAHGSATNITYYFKQFQIASGQYIGQLVEFKEQLENAMLPVLKLSLTSKVFNSGRKPIVIGPYARVRILNNDIEQRDYIVKVEEVMPSSEENLWEGYFEVGGIEAKEDFYRSDMLGDSFLPQMTGSSYVLVPPNSEVQIRLISEELGPAGAHLKKIYDVNLLRCEVTLLDIDGEDWQSGTFLFGLSVDADLKKELANIP